MASITDEEHRDEELDNVRALLDSTPQIHLVRSADGRSVLWVSRSYERIFGRSRQSLYDDPRSWLEAVVPADRPRVVRLYAERPRAFESEHRILRPSGDIRWVRARTFPMGAGPGARLGGVIEDITARKEAESRFSQLAGVGLLGILVAAPAWRILEINDTLLDMLGYTREEILSGAVPWSSLTPPDWMPGLDEAVEQLQTRGVAPLREKEFLHKDGHRVPVLLGSARLEGGVEGEVITFVLDLTERKKAEQSLALLRRERAADARFRALLEAAPDAMVITDDEDRVVLVNAETERMFGHPRADLLDRGLSTLIPAHLHGELRVRRAGGRAAFELSGLRRDGSTFPIEMTVALIETDEGRLWSSAIRDVSERKLTESALTAANAALQIAKESADAANRAKSAFLANMSHEIRTPMNAILGYTQLLQRDPELGPKQIDRLAIVARSGEHLLDLINDVLEMSKIEAGHREISRDSVDLQALVGDLTRMFRLRADAAGLLFAVRCDEALPPYLMGDERKLRQVLVNLLGNAVKFTARGGVELSLRVRRGEDGGERLVAEVRDSGPGISRADLLRLFQPFSQTRVGIEARGGTGLGLALSREFARLMGGDIEVESRPGEGSVFRLDLPLERGRATSILPPSLPGGRVVGLEGVAPRVLVVDDDGDNRCWVSDLLSLVGFDVRSASDGAEALALSATWSPRLILMDMNMPVMDGFAAMRAIRARPDGASVVLIAVTASVFDEARVRIFAAGADGWLRKPCREADLLAEIQRHLGLTYRHAEAPPPPSPRDANGEASLAALPPDLLASLRQALLIADHEHLGDLIRSIPPDQAAIAGALGALAERFAYEEMAGLLG